MRRRVAVVAKGWLIAGIVFFAAHAAAQPAYPNKPIRFIVPYAAGGSVEPMARLFTVRLNENLGQPMIVDLRPGGNTIIGTELTAKAAPDGYTYLVMTVQNHAINALLIPNLPYDSVKDFAPVASVGTSDYVLVLHPSVPADNLREFITFARARPGQLNYGSIGSLGISQLGVEFFCQMTGIKMQRVPYKGSAPALIDLVSGQMQVGFNTPISALQHIRVKRLKPIAISGEWRLTALPDVPTFTEAGLPGYEMRVTFALLAPAATPRAHIDKIASEIGKIVATVDFQEKLAMQGTKAFYANPEQLAAMLRADMAKYAKVIKAANLRFEK